MTSLLYAYFISPTPLSPILPFLFLSNFYSVFPLLIPPSPSLIFFLPLFFSYPSSYHYLFAPSPNSSSSRPISPALYFPILAPSLSYFPPPPSFPPSHFSRLTCSCWPADRRQRTSDDLHAGQVIFFCFGLSWPSLHIGLQALQTAKKKKVNSIWKWLNRNIYAYIYTVVKYRLAGKNTIIRKKKSNQT